MNIVNVVGARPNFVKISPIVQILLGEGLGGDIPSRESREQASLLSRNGG